jgi:hypothetical protein
VVPLFVVVVAFDEGSLLDLEKGLRVFGGVLVK